MNPLGPGTRSGPCTGSPWHLVPSTPGSPLWCKPEGLAWGPSGLTLLPRHLLALLCPRRSYSTHRPARTDASWSHFLLLPHTLGIKACTACWLLLWPLSQAEKPRLSSCLPPPASEFLPGRYPGL